MSYITEPDEALPTGHTRAKPVCQECEEVLMKCPSCAAGFFCSICDKCRSCTYTMYTTPRPEPQQQPRKAHQKGGDHWRNGEYALNLTSEAERRKIRIGPTLPSGPPKKGREDG